MTKPEDAGYMEMFAELREWDEIFNTAHIDALKKEREKGSDYVADYLIEAYECIFDENKYLPEDDLPDWMPRIKL